MFKMYTPPPSPLKMPSGQKIGVGRGGKIFLPGFFRTEEKTKKEDLKNPRTSSPSGAFNNTELVEDVFIWALPLHCSPKQG